MPTYKCFEELPVWRAAIDLGLRIFHLTDERAFNQQGDLRSQLRRAALSISNNIAEGFERGTTNELLSFLYISRGSAGEVRSMLIFAERLDRITRAPNAPDLKSTTESCSRQIRAWADSLQNSDIRGPRHLNDRVREQLERRRSREDFFRRLETLRADVG